MKELKLEEPVNMKLEQYQCPGCRLKFYLSVEDVKELDADTVLDCPSCDIMGMKHVRSFEIAIHKIFEED